MGIDADIAGKAFDMSFSYIATQVVVGSISSDAKALTSGNGVGSNLSKSIKATQEVIPGTNIPKSFVMKGKIVNGKEIWVHGNATKHMGEFVNSANNSILVESELMSSFQNTVSEILPKVQPGRNFFNLNGWEIGINGDTAVIYHALFK